MTKIIIDWSEWIENTSYSIENSKNDYFDLTEAVYMYVHAEKQPDNIYMPGKQPLYIGQVYKRQNNETVKDRIYEHFNDQLPEYFERNCAYTVFIKIGKIILQNSETISQELIENIECCLINTNQPLCEIEENKVNYHGDSICIENIGKYRPLAHICAYKGN